MLLAKHKSIEKLFDEKFWKNYRALKEVLTSPIYYENAIF
jgi:hypothetical protein